MGEGAGFLLGLAVDGRARLGGEAAGHLDPTEGMRGGVDLLILPPLNPSWLRRPLSRPGPAPQFWGPASRLSGPLPEHGFQCCRDKDWDLCLSACSLQVPLLPVPLSEPVVPVFPGKLVERALWPSPALLSFYLLHPWGR